jgi:hypothetical protein
MMAGLPASYFWIKAFSETDLTEDLKKFDVPTRRRPDRPDRRFSDALLRLPEDTVPATIGSDPNRAATTRFADYFAEANNDQLLAIVHHVSGAGARP